MKISYEQYFSLIEIHLFLQLDNKYILRPKLQQTID